LAAYNWGQGNLNKYGLGAAPQETRDYITRVKASMASRANSGSPIVMASNQPGLNGSGFDVAAGKVEVIVHLPNAPAGTTASVTSKGNVSAKTRIGYSTMTQVTP
jgi:hypothetical protein